MRRFLLFLPMLFFFITAFAQTTDPTRVPVFTMGESGSQYYRIPALVETADGTLVALADQRGSALGDLPNIISIVSKRSTDGGATWESMVTIAQGNSTAGTTYGDAAAVYDEQAGKIIAVFVGNENYGSNTVGLWASNSSYPLRIYQSESTDNGQTWTTPVDISSSIYNGIYGSSSSWIGMFAGSGSALQLKQGTNAGRLMFVVAARKNSTWGGAMSNYAVYSDDHGATWNVSTNAACSYGDEAKVVELENGDILMSIKNRKDDSSAGSGYRLMAKSTDGGVTWTTASVNNNLMDPACNGDLVSVSYNGTYYLMHSLPGSTTTRENVTVYLSADGGETWPIKRTIYESYSAYSSLEVLNDGTVGILVEEGKWDSNIAGDDGFNIAYYNFTMDWLTEKVKYTASVSANEGGTATINGGTADVTVEDGSTVTLAATPATGYTFKNWTVEGTIVSTENPYTATVTSNTQYVANFQDPNAVEYCTWNGNMTNGGRRFDSFSVSDGTFSSQVSSIQTSTSSAVYIDKTAVSIKVLAGSTVTFTNFAWSGEWMHAYAYVDYNKDGVFNTTVNANGTNTTGELVSYNYYNNYNSLGNSANAQYATGNSYNGSVGLPKFVIPSTLANGNYRFRIKIDWNNTDPCGDAAIAQNGGCIVDMTISIVNPPSATDPSDETLALIETAKDILDGVGVGYPAEAPRQALREAIATAEANPNAAAATPLQTAINAYYASTDIVRPTSGATYAFVAVNTSVKLYFYNNNGTLSLASYTDGMELPETAHFTCEISDGKYMFKTADNAYYLAYPTIGGKSWLDNESVTGLESSISDVTRFDIEKILNGGNVTADNETLFGLTYMYGYRGYDNTKSTDIYGPIVVKSSASAFDGANDPYFNTNFTSAISIKEIAGVETSIKPIAMLSEQRIFAANGAIHIRNYSGSLKVINILGQVVKETTISDNTQIKMAKGIYFVVTNDKASKVVIK